jgi:hypothetical protein
MIGVSNSYKMSTTPSLPSRIKPVRGTCRWVSRRNRVLRINAVHYTVVPVGTRYRLMNWNTGAVYDIDAAGRWCTCPSFVWDHCPVQAGGDGRCKHIAALRTLGLLPEAEADQPFLIEAQSTPESPSLRSA